MNNNLIKYLEDLIHCESITPLSAGAIEYMNDLLQDFGFSTEIKIFGNYKYKVTNLYAVYGNNSPNICFAGHVDVVPPGDFRLWGNSPFTATLKKDKIFGRGAVDMKGALACALSASFNFIRSNEHHKGSISFLITSDEEGEGEFGTKRMLQYLYSKKDFHKIDLAILGEPTCKKEVGDVIKIGRRGSINFTVIIRGMQGHVAYPELACNPINCLVKIFNDLTNDKLDNGSEFFQSSNLVITSIDVDNNATNVIPQEASAKFNVRFNNIHSPNSMIDLINKVISKYCTSYQLNHHSSAVSFIQEPIGLINEFANVVKDTLGIKPAFTTDGGTSDARFLKDYCQVVEFGLLTETAHKIDEYTKINDLQRLYDVYYDSLKKFLS